MIRVIGLLSVLSLSAPILALTHKPEERAAESVIETRVLRAISTGSLHRLQAAAEDVRDLKPAERAQLPFRIRPEAVEFRFRGEYPGGESVHEMLEYVISNRDKDYESLLVAGREELDRLKKLGQALAALKKAGKQASLEYRLVWVDKDQAHVEDLQSIVGLLQDAKRNEFLAQIGFNEYGLGGEMNVKADPALLPTRRTAAELLLTVRLR
jgi:hypothetical protein